MLDFLGHRDAHDAILAAIEAALDPRGGGPRTRDLGGTASTSDLGRAVVDALAQVRAATH
jgi:tartrate dehydrogenase/decarboxylase/D-malate dehydrogenase